MKEERIDQLRHLSRKLVRELGMLQLNQGKETPPHWHALIEISREPNLTISQLGHLLVLSTSTTSRIVTSLVKGQMITFKDGLDRREKYLCLTKKGQAELKKIDEFSNAKVHGAFAFLSKEEQDQVICSIEKYGNALERNRLLQERIKIHTLSTSRAMRKQIVNMIEAIQKDEFGIPITPAINAGILRAEEEYYYNKSYNFWYAVDHDGKVIGSIGLKRISKTSGELKKFFVDKNYRGLKVAQKLMKALLKAAQKHDFKFLYLGTVDVLKAAHRFYEKAGFSRIPVEELPTGFNRVHLDNTFFKATVEAAQDRLFSS